MGTRPVSEDGGVMSAKATDKALGANNSTANPTTSASSATAKPASAPTPVSNNPTLHLQGLTARDGNNGNNGNNGNKGGNNGNKPEPARRSASPEASGDFQPSSSASYASTAPSGGRSARRRADTGTRSSLPPSLPGAAAVVLDRRLLQQYEQVNQEIERVVRASQMEAGGDRAALHQVRGELRQARKSSSQLIQAQKELLEKMERQERGGVRRFFTVNRAAKTAKLRAKLRSKLSESVLADEELQRLERQSTALSATALGTITQGGAAVVLNVSNLHSASVSAGHTHGGSGLEEATASHDVSGSESSGGLAPLRMSTGLEDAQEELLLLEREKEDILTNLFQAVDMPAVLDLHARIASFSSEIKAVASVKKQADRVEELYRKALHLLRVALAAVVSPNYSGSIREFATSAYPLAVEAGHLIEAACHVIQPEARRKYELFATELTHVRPPKFPQPVADFARRSRTHYDPHSALSIEGMRNLHAAENVVILLQRLVIQKLEGLDKWQAKLAKDQEAAERAHAVMETRLQEQVAVMARSVSV
ncbi:hypothetical protein BBJ28_00017951 [Nothophytophthora sp. Chile5]|nr:hypothetical protein BBJ28_00017951 [Nothophytophthora sp. Chile5]